MDIKEFEESVRALAYSLYNKGFAAKAFKHTEREYLFSRNRMFDPYLISVKLDQNGEVSCGKIGDIEVVKCDNCL